jgi:hypothetical protein
MIKHPKTKQMKYLFYMFIGVWEGYCVGQQQDSEEFLRKIMEGPRGSAVIGPSLIISFSAQTTH